MIIYQATQAPSRSMFLEGKGPSFINDYISIGKKLKHAGADILCMSCNTAHFAIDEIKNKINLPFINLIEEVVIKAKNSKKTHFGLIASDGCLNGKVYEKYFFKFFPDAKLIYLSEKYQIKVTTGICNIKNIARFFCEDSSSRPKNIFREVTEHLLSLGSELVIIGCTDIRVDFTHPYTIDSLEVLANKIYNITKCEQ
jgi:aspartate racemase